MTPCARERKRNADIGKSKQGQTLFPSLESEYSCSTAAADDDLATQNKTLACSSTCSGQRNSESQKIQKTKTLTAISEKSLSLQSVARFLFVCLSLASCFWTNTQYQDSSSAADLPPKTATPSPPFSKSPGKKNST
jgi:hypothetical protein